MDIDVSDVARDIVAQERALLADLQALLARLEAGREHVDDLRNAMRDLDGIFMLVVAGEFNAGKSSLLNALVGEAVMPEGVTPTTDRITVVTYADQPGESEEAPALVRRSFPAPLLRDLALVDTPGTNAIIKRHQELTERFVPRADLVLFVTSADRPFTESERAFLELIASWGKKVLMVVNKVDILEGKDAEAKVLDYVRDHARTTLGTTPEVFGVSAKRAFKARLANDVEGVQASGLGALERAISARLGSERLKLKLLSPLGVARRTAEHYREVLSGRLELLAHDRGTLDEIERQRDQFEKDMRREYDGYLARIENVLLEVEKRGFEFFDDTVQLRKLFMLMNTGRVREAFQSRVLRSVDQDIDLAVGALVDWFIQRNLQLWEDVMTFVNERRAAERERVIGEVGGRFQYDRQALVRALHERSEKVLESYDQKAEASRLADSLQGAVVQSGLLEVGGIGLGAAVLAILTTTAVDITGVALGLALMGVGLLVMPRQRRKAKRELSARMTELREGLGETLSGQLEAELARSQEKLSGAINPYTRFVRAELERLGALEGEMDTLEERMASVRREVEGLA
ncbi:MAG TPA: dynamin family protein [Trueperaceae bacterium]|nr:dynamin family protein [Trueperaceae bacterium]